MSFESSYRVQEPLMSSVVEDAEHSPGDADAPHGIEERLELHEVMVEPSERPDDHRVADAKASPAEHRDPHEEDEGEEEHVG